MEVKREEIKINCENLIIEKDDEVKGHCNVALSSCDNADSAPTNGGNTNERFERKKKTRRGKPKGKNYKPYNKVPKIVEGKAKRVKHRCNSRLTYDQPEAPNNSNQFLIEDHNFHQIPDLSPKTGIMLTPINHRKCNRDSSFTSVESDGDDFYSSPEDEEEFLTKEFSETYKDLHEESLSNMSKTDLIRQVLSLEEKLETLTKKKKLDGSQDGTVTENEVLPQERFEALECENNWLKREVERLNTEVNILRRQCRSSDSSIDSESDSSSTSSSSDSSSSDSRPESPVLIVNNGDVHDDPVVQMEEDIAETTRVEDISTNGTANTTVEHV